MKKTDKRKNEYLKWIILPLLLVGIVTLYYVNRSTSAQLPHSASSAANVGAPQFTLIDIAGRSHSLSDYRGKVIILDFWAPWCPPCKREIPDFIALQNKYGSAGLQVVGIGLDQQNNVISFARQNALNYPVLIGNDEVSNLYGGISGIPTTFIIDKEGNIVETFEGFTSRAVFETAIKKLL